MPGPKTPDIVGYLKIISFILTCVYLKKKWNIVLISKKIYIYIYKFYHDLIGPLKIFKRACEDNLKVEVSFIN